MNLQAALEPLLTELWQAADTMYMGQAMIDPANPSEIAQAEKGRGYLHSDLDSLISRFRGYYTLDGHDLDPIAAQFAGPDDSLETPTGTSVYCAIGRAAEDVNEVGKLIHYEQWFDPDEKWHGQAAASFHGNFLDPFAKTALVHAVGARDLAIGATAVAAAIELAKECVAWVCRDAISRLKQSGDAGTLPGKEAPDYRKSATFIAILADSVALFVALAAPEIVILDVTLAAIGVGGGLVAEWEREDGEHEAPIGVPGSESAMAIVHNTWTALDNLDLNIGEFDEKAARGIDAELDPSGPLGSVWATIQNPHLNPKAFGQLTFGSPASAATDAEDGVITSIVRLYYAGYRTLPAAAQEYDLGAKLCASATIDTARKQFPRASESFNTLAERFGRLMEGVRDDLTDSGSAIVKAAEDYHTTDAHEAAEIRKLTAAIPAAGNFAANSNWDRPAWLTP